ncbi:MAG: hypothetical protein U5N58_13755 [Actinomycetota bacterium]|nr:hypothetical protein [Actinomycetota bacterium]
MITGYVEGYFYLEYEGNGNKLLIQPGEYVVDYYHQGELIDSASFKVLPPEVKITEISLARSIDEQTMAPTDTTAEFEPGDNIYATVRLNNSVAGDYFEARWYYGQEPIIEKTVDIEQNYFEESYIAFSLTSEESWQPGGYSVEIYYNGNQHGTYDFMVAGPELEETSEEYPFSKGLIYTNEDYNFQFAVPDGWEISENIEEDGLGVELKYAAEQIPVAIVFMASNPESALPEEDYKVQSDELAAEAASASELELIEEIQGEDINSFNIPFHEYSYKYNDAEGREFGMVFDFFKGADRTYVLFIFSLEEYYDMSGQLYDGIVNSFNYIE